MRLNLELNAKIDRLYRLSRNAKALCLEDSWREIMIALGGCLIERDFGRRHKSRL